MERLPLSDEQIERVGILMEEIGEALQALGKIQCHGFDSEYLNEEGLTNRQWLEKELSHVRFAMSLMNLNGDIDEEEIFQWFIEKKIKVKPYLHCESNIESAGKTTW
jgi:hypothetical protein